MAQRESLHFLGALPIDTELVSLLDNEEPGLNPTEQEGVMGNNVEPVLFPLLERYRRTPTFRLFQVMLQKALPRLISSWTDQIPPS